MNAVDSLALHVPIIIAFLTGVAGPVLVTFLKHKLSVRKSVELAKRRKDFNVTIDVQQRINKSLNDLQQKFNLDRVWVAQFHNGGNYYPGNKSMKKLSITFESTKPGVSSDILKLQNIPVSFFSGVVQVMNTDQLSYVVDTDTEIEDNAFKDFWVKRGVKRSYLFPILCLEGGFIAILGIDYVNRDGFLPEQLYREFELESKLLSGYIATVSVEKN